MKLYKFRPDNNHLLDILKNQYIYLSDLKGLNDPMEGIRTIYWKGSKEDWLKIFEHYFFCLFNIIEKNAKTFNELDLDLKKYNIKQYENLQSEVRRLFLKDNIIQKCAELFSTKKLDKSILILYFRAISLCALNIIKLINNDDKLSESFIESYNINSKYYCCPYIDPITRLDILNKISNFTINDLSSDETIKSKSFVYFLNLFTKNKGPIANIYSIKILEHIIQYFDILEDMLNSKVLISSFSSSYNDPTMWSHYSSNNTGICLIFDQEILTKNLDKKYVFDKIAYEEKYQEVNFFDAFNFYNNSKKDCKIYPAIYLSKLKNWESEKEYRILMKVEQNEEEQKLFYNPKALVGIIFGIKTSNNLREEIIKIFIKNSEVGLYGAYYSNKTHQIEKTDLRESMRKAGQTLLSIVNYGYY